GGEVRRVRAVQLPRLEPGDRAWLRAQALELRGRQTVSGGVLDPRWPAGQLRQRLEHALESADLCGAGLRRGHDRLPWLHRLWPGVYRRDQPALGRPSAGRSAERLEGRAAEVSVP